jgi:hypothetical protein
MSVFWKVSFLEDTMPQLKKWLLPVAALGAMALVPIVSEAGPVRFAGRVAARTTVGAARVGVAATPPYRPYYRPTYSAYSRPSYGGYYYAPRTVYYPRGYYR